MLRLLDICIQKLMSMQGSYTVWFKSHLTGPAYFQKEAAMQNTSDQTNLFPVAEPWAIWHSGIGETGEN